MSRPQRTVATIETPHGGRYLRMLCRHLGRKLEATHTQSYGTIRMGSASCQLDSCEHGLRMRIESSNAADLARMQQVVGAHLEKFARSQPVNVHWTAC